MCKRRESPSLAIVWKYGKGCEHIHAVGLLFSSPLPNKEQFAWKTPL
jgi:hypothetical protein